ncbi:hypothetical protein ACX12E_14490 [Paenibacillus vandeheii]
MSDPYSITGWAKSLQPVFRKSIENNVYATGHNSFTTSPDGLEDWRTGLYIMLFLHRVQIPVYGQRAFKNLNGTAMEHLILVCLSAMIMRFNFHRESET